MSSNNGCVRCPDKNVIYSQMSWFNTDNICKDCADIEQLHPLYSLARKIETLAVETGDYNYPGIGLPEGYEEWAEQQKQQQTATTPKETI